MKLLITTILIISSLNSCASLRNINLVSASDEIKMGEEYSSYMEKTLEMCRNEIVNSYIDSLGQSLTSNSKRSNVTYKFKVILDKSINALIDVQREVIATRPRVGDGLDFFREIVIDRRVLLTDDFSKLASCDSHYSQSSRGMPSVSFCCFHQSFANFITLAPALFTIP